MLRTYGIAVPVRQENIAALLDRIDFRAAADKPDDQRRKAANRVAFMTLGQSRRG